MNDLTRAELETRLVAMERRFEERFAKARLEAEERNLSLVKWVGIVVVLLVGLILAIGYAISVVSPQPAAPIVINVPLPVQSK
jgi:anti-sigma-K factor RskA